MEGDEKPGFEIWIVHTGSVVTVFNVQSDFIPYENSAVGKQNSWRSYFYEKLNQIVSVRNTPDHNLMIFFDLWWRCNMGAEGLTHY